MICRQWGRTRQQHVEICCYSESTSCSKWLPVHTWRFLSWLDCWRRRRWPPFRLSLALLRSQCFGTWFSFCRQIRAGQMSQWRRQKLQEKSDYIKNKKKNKTATVFQMEWFIIALAVDEAWQLSDFYTTYLKYRARSVAMMQTSNKCCTVSNWRFWRLQKIFRLWSREKKTKKKNKTHENT